MAHLSLSHRLQFPIACLLTFCFFFAGCPEPDGDIGPEPEPNPEPEIVLVTSIAVDGPSSVTTGETIQLEATVSPENASDSSIEWSTSDGSIATVDSSGSVIGIAPGVVAITASSKDGSEITGSHAVTVTEEPILVTGMTISGATMVGVDQTTQLSATVTPSDASDKTVTWSSTNASIATIDATGLVTGVAVGDVTISATANDGSGVTVNHSMAVTEDEILVTSITVTGDASIVVHSTATLNAAVLPATATDPSVSWMSSDTGIATVDSIGVVTGVAAGTATITASANDGSGVSGTYDVTVTADPVLVTSISVSGNTTVAVSGTTALTATVLPTDATDSTVSWMSSDTGIATVDSSGVVTGVAAGTATITATANDASGVSGTYDVTVTEEITNSIDNFDVEYSQEGGPGFGTVTITLTYTGGGALNMRDAKITFTAPFAVSAVWGGGVNGSISSPTFSVNSSGSGTDHTVEVTLGLGMESWIDAILETGDSIEIKFSPADSIDLANTPFEVISVEATPQSTGGTDSGPPVVTDPVDLHVPGWGNCLAMGTVSNGSSSINQALADSKVSVIYKYAGPGGNGDRGHIVEPTQTEATIAQARAVEAIIAGQESSPRTILPLMVVYTAEASGGGAAEYDIIYTGEATQGDDPEPNSENLKKHFINLIRIAKTLQGNKDTDHPHPGSIVLNPDLLGAWQQNETTQFNTHYRDSEGSFRAIAIKDPLQEAIDWVIANDGAAPDFDPTSVPSSITEDVLGFVQSQNYLIRQYAPDVTFGWQINLWAPGTSLWIHTRYNSESHMWNSVSSKVTDFIDTLGVYSGDWVPDFVTFDKYERDGLGNEARGVGYAYNNLDWDNYLLFVKQVTDHFGKPALLWQIPGGHMPSVGETVTNYDIDKHAATGGPYFMGDQALTGLDQISDDVLNISLGAAAESIYGAGVTTVEGHLKEDPDFDWTKQRLRKAAFSNAFAILWGGGSTTSVVDIGSSGNDDGWLAERVANYYDYGCMKITNGEAGDSGGSLGTTISGNSALDDPLLNNEATYNSEVLITQQPDNTWAESTVYRWNDFLLAVKAMYLDGIGDEYKLWLGGDDSEEPDAALRAKYGLVNLAAFLAQSMKETIKYDACDENNWSFEEHWAGNTKYPITSACGQLDQDYSGYGINPDTSMDYVESCPVMPKAEISAVTNAQWYGAPGPLFAAPDSAMIEAGLPVDSVTGYWTHQGDCQSVPEDAAGGQAYQRPDCQVYAGQKAGQFLYDGTAYQQPGSVEGCIWWGRGVIQTTGRYNFGLLNHYLGRSHMDVTDPAIRASHPIPSEILYPDMDFCSNPEFICSTTKYPELKWIAGLFYWMSSVQTYDVGGWNYMDELKAYVNSDFTGDAFINSVSGIVNRGCHNPPCGTGPLDGGAERKDNFIKVLQAMDLID